MDSRRDDWLRLWTRRRRSIDSAAAVGGEFGMTEPECEPADRDMKRFGELLDLGDAGDGASGFGHLHKVVRSSRDRP